MVNLFDHQKNAVTQIMSEWFTNPYANVLSVLPTGAGKTILKAEMARREITDNPNGVVIIFAHRDILLEQISDALCMFGLKHSFITSVKTRKQITDMQILKYGKSFDEDGSRIIVASVDKFRQTDTTFLNELVTLWMLDEAHHLLVDGKWDACIDRFPNARGLGVTATPIRADLKGLGSHANGVFDALVVGATMHELILLERLCTYKVYTPPTYIDMTGVNVTAGGDYNQKKNAKATDKAEVTGDVVKNYLRIAQGKRAICFATNIEHGEHLAQAFRDAGVRAVNLSSKTEPGLRNRKINEFKNGLIDVLVNCDLFSEGFDVPGVEVVIMVRKTMSYSLFKQQFGRMLRVIEGKSHGILIDHVGNVDFMMHKYNLSTPHDDPTWTLDDYKKFQINDDGKKCETKVCSECFNRYYPRSVNDFECPECSHTETVDEQLDTLKKYQAKEADLVPMTIDFIDRLMAQRKQVDLETNKIPISFTPNTVHRNSAMKNHEKRLIAQDEFRALYDKYCLALWMTGNYDVEAVQMQFEIDFGVNMLNAQVASATDTLRLIVKMKEARV